MSTHIMLVFLWLLPVAIVVSTQLAASGKLHRNGFAGFRIPSTMASDAAWREGHRAAAPIVWLTVPVAIAGSIAAAIVDPGPQPTPTLWLGLLVVVMAAIVIAAAVVAHKAARRVGRAD